ncbi:hypothetical protein A2U01_0060007, partial [Trifolium medium]|nr:hypothetical protein [Trifolium medium]
MHIGGGLKSAEENLEAKNEEIKKIWHSNQKLREEKDLVWENLKRWKSGYQEKVQKLQEASRRHQEYLQAENVERK